jgi:hypothetical protein
MEGIRGGAVNPKGKKGYTIYEYLIVGFTIINIFLIGFTITIWIGGAQQGLFSKADFTNYYTAYVMVRAGDGGKLYDLDIQAAYQREILGPLTFKDGLLPFLNPPFFALVFSPLSLLPLNTAFIVWTLVQLGLLLWLIYLLTHLFIDWDKQERLILTLTILAFWPLAITILLGQVSLFILICIVQMYTAMNNSKQVHAGFWLALMMVKPQTVLIPGMITLNKRYWRVAVIAAITFITLVLFSSIFLGFKPWIQYAQLLPTMSNYFGKYGFYPEIQYTLRGILSTILGYSQVNIINIISYVFLLTGMVIVMFLWLHDIPPNSPRFKLRFAFIMTLSIFLSLHLYTHDSLILVLPAALFYDYLRQMRFPRKVFSILILSCPLLFFYTAFSKFNFFGIIRPPIVVILLLLAWMIKYLILDYRKNPTNGIAITGSNPS